MSLPFVPGLKWKGEGQVLWIAGGGGAVWHHVLWTTCEIPPFNDLLDRGEI